MVLINYSALKYFQVRAGHSNSTQWGRGGDHRHVSTFGFWGYHRNWNQLRGGSTDWAGIRVDSSPSTPSILGLHSEESEGMEIMCFQSLPLIVSLGRIYFETFFVSHSQTDPSRSGRVLESIRPPKFIARCFCFVLDDSEVRKSRLTIHFAVLTVVLANGDECASRGALVSAD